MYGRIFHDTFFRYYRIHTQDDFRLPGFIEPEKFWQQDEAEQMAQELNAPTYYWASIVTRFGSSIEVPNESLVQRVGRMLLLGWVKIYRVRHLDESRGAPAPEAFATWSGGPGLRWELAPASVLLVHSRAAELKTFRTTQEAEAFVAGFNLSPGQATALLRASGDLSERTHATPPLGRLAQALVDGKVVVLIHRQGVLPPQGAAKTPEVLPATGPGNRPMTLGPHAGSDSQIENTTEPSSSFKDQDSAAKAALDEANPQSIRDNLEYGGVIYRDNVTGEYGFTGPIKGSDQGVNPFSEPLPPNAEIVGDYHTHADYSIVDKETGAAIRTSDPGMDDFNSDNFSSQDIKGITSDGKGVAGYKGYLGTPSGQYKVFDPATGKTSILK